MKIEYFNTPKPEILNPSILPAAAAFLSHVPDFKFLEDSAKKYAKYKNIIILGHGGSITSIYGFYNALKYQAKKHLEFLSTVDPDAIAAIKQTYNPQETLVLVISKSGDTVTLLEMFSQFLEYPMLVVTGANSSLRAMAEKLQLPVADHPPIGGRYVGLTEVALLPASLAGLQAEEMYDGAAAMYAQYEKGNAAWQMASVMWQLEQQGYVDVFMPFYSHNLFPMSALIVQLCHESFGKEGRGQTYFAHEAPESQHHTNQRFFGGPKNICGIFTTVENFQNNTVVEYPENVQEVWIKSIQLKDINSIPLAKAINFEAHGSMEDARIHGIPLVHISLDSVSPEEVGALTAFWQMYAVYASALRNVDPFNQPQVENSKAISFHKRLQFKGVL